jgi:hypothetical protein
MMSGYERDITDQRYTEDAAWDFLHHHWGNQYSIQRPNAPGGQWSATALFGQHDQILEWSAGELLEEIRAHRAAWNAARNQRSTRGET